MSSTNRIYCNPFAMYAFSWVIVFVLYLLDWSDKFPKLTLDLVLFISFTCFVSIIIAIRTHKKGVFRYVPIEKTLAYLPWIMKWTKRVYILLFLEFVVCRTVPFIDYLRGVADGGDYMTFGIPFVHVVVLNGLFFLFYVSSYCYFSSNHNRVFLKPMLLNISGPILFMSRGSVLYMIFSIFCFFLMSSMKAKRTILAMIPSSLIVLYLFGLMGNMRTNDPEGVLIRQWGGASAKYEETGLPSEFFWSYLYIASPMGDLQNAVKYAKRFDKDYCGPVNLVVNQILPKFIGKRLNRPEVSNRSDYYVDPTMVVGTTYMEPYLTWGWKGVYIVFLCLMFIPLWMKNHIPVGSLVRVPMYIVVTNMLFFSMFDNMLTYMGLFPQLVFLYLLRNFKINEKNTVRHRPV